MDEFSSKPHKVDARHFSGCVCWELELMDGSVSVTEEMLTGDDVQTKADAQVARSSVCVCLGEGVWKQAQKKLLCKGGRCW